MLLVVGSIIITHIRGFGYVHIYMEDENDRKREWESLGKWGSTKAQLMILDLRSLQLSMLIVPRFGKVIDWNGLRIIEIVRSCKNTADLVYTHASRIMSFGIVEVKLVSFHTNLPIPVHPGRNLAEFPGNFYPFSRL